MTALNINIGAQTSGFSTAVSEINRVKESIRKIAGGGESGGGSPGLTGFLGGFTLVGLAKAGQDLLEFEKKWQKIDAMLVLANGPVAAAKEMEYVRKTVDELGLDLESTAEGYAKFSQAAKLAGTSAEDTKTIFEGISTAAAATGASAEQTKGIYAAFQQILSKNRLSAEELSGQLGDRLAGAISIAAKALGMSTKELYKNMEQANITGEAAVNLGAQLKIAFAGANTNQLTNQMNRLSSAVVDFKRNITQDSGLAEYFSSVVSQFARGLKEAAGVDLRPVLSPLKERGGQTFGLAVGAVTAGAGALGLAALGVLSNALLAASIPVVAFSALLASTVSALASVPGGVEFMVTTLRDAASSISRAISEAIKSIGGSSEDAKKTFSFLVGAVKDSIVTIVDLTSSLARFLKIIPGAGREEPKTIQEAQALADRNALMLGEGDAFASLVDRAFVGLGAIKDAFLSGSDPNQAEGVLDRALKALDDADQRVVDRINAPVAEFQARQQDQINSAVEARKKAADEARAQSLFDEADALYRAEKGTEEFTKAMEALSKIDARDLNKKLSDQIENINSSKDSSVSSTEKKFVSGEYTLEQRDKLDAEIKNRAIAAVDAIKEIGAQEKSYQEDQQKLLDLRKTKASLDDVQVLPPSFMEVIKGFGEGRRAAAQTFKGVQEERLSEQKRSVDRAIMETEAHAKETQNTLQKINDKIGNLLEAIKVI